MTHDLGVWMNKPSFLFDVSAWHYTVYIWNSSEFDSSSLLPDFTHLNINMKPTLMALKDICFIRNCIAVILGFHVPFSDDFFRAKVHGFEHGPWNQRRICASTSGRVQKHAARRCWLANLKTLFPKKERTNSIVYKLYLEKLYCICFVMFCFYDLTILLFLCIGMILSFFMIVFTSCFWWDTVTSVCAKPQSSPMWTENIGRFWAWVSQRHCSRQHWDDPQPWPIQLDDVPIKIPSGELTFCYGKWP